ncbi:shikimate dehydrogenase [Sphingomonas aerolata]|uniref:Shikimate dehydrogenase (NADP(+)) n=1 Tax=Sphingomonas aerolata TaxID=185951 RepID=A0A2T4YVT0_9SPHN|nr:shikimate dehydrogenase [Sphingomonas aerolata]PTM47893.1 shikimate dehydrogenase [Sphingomonas aerolata]
MTPRPYAEVIGDPIAQSKSPLIHGFWLDALGIDAEYRHKHVTAEELPAYFAERKSDPAWRGCNITMPHKLAALDHVSDPGDVRGSIGAINTVFRNSTGDCIGTNTDAAGFWAPIDDLDIAGQPVTVIGAGGAARAILFALSRMGVGPVTILNRNPLKAAALLSTFKLKGQALPIGPAVPPSRLLVNASILGMAGQPPLDLDLGALDPDSLVYDIVYSPLETGLLKAARARDLETVDGLEMLIGQAAVAFEILFHVEPPRDRDEALRALLTA